MNRTKKVSFLFLTVILLLVILVVWQVSKAGTFQLFGKLIWRLDTNKPIVALTFDDGPKPFGVNQVLPILNQYGIKATFFVSGIWVEKYPNLARNIVKAGHELGNHSFSHKRMILRSTEWIENEIETTDSLIRNAGYNGPIYFRPPFGKKLVNLPRYLAANQRVTVMWNVDADSKYYQPGDKKVIVESVLSNTRPGSIVLMHTMVSARQPSIDALPEIIEGLHKKGFSFVTLSQSLASK